MSKVSERAGVPESAPESLAACLFLRCEAYRQLSVIISGEFCAMHFFDVPAECSAERRLHIERKWMIAGGTTLHVALLDEVRGKGEAAHRVIISESLQNLRVIASSKLSSRSWLAAFRFSLIFENRD